MEQRTFADLEYEAKKRVTRREKFLARMERLIPSSLRITPPPLLRLRLWTTWSRSLSIPETFSLESAPSGGW